MISARGYAAAEIDFSKPIDDQQQLLPFERSIPMSEFEDMFDCVTGYDEDGNEVVLRIIDFFFYQGEEYAILCDAADEADEETEDVDCFVMKVVPGTDENGEEVEDFEPIEDEKLESKLIEVASNVLDGEDEE